MPASPRTPSFGTAPFPAGLRGFMRGVFAVFRGLGRLLTERELRRLALIPVLMTSVLYAVFVGLAFTYFDDLLTLVWARPETWLVYAWYAVSVIVFVAMLLTLALVFLPIASVLGGPFYEKMALLVLARRSIHGQTASLIDGIRSALARLAVFALPALFFAGLSLIPYLGLVFVPVATTFGWLGLAAETSEPTLVAANHSLGARLRLVFSSFFPMMGVGMVVGLSLLVPLLPLLSLPAAIIGFAELYEPSGRGRGDAAA